jgi:phosphoglycolate phosphatase-like HAD superfamily hydrolase
VLLLLFDVDGTLFLTDDALWEPATAAAAREVFGVDMRPGAMDGIDHPGRTARRIGRELLRAHGVTEAKIDRGLDRWCAALSAAYLALLAETDTTDWVVAPEAADTLSALAGSGVSALLTGNPEPVARARMERLGLAGFFPAGQGGFGCEADDRAELVGIARARAGADGPWPAERTVLVGDTPADVEAARAAGVRAVGVTLGRFDEDALAGADAVVSRLGDLPAALALRP